MSPISASVELDAQHLLGARAAHVHGFALWQARHVVDRRPRLAAADFEYQPGRALYSVDIVVEVDAALEAVRGVAGEIVAARAAHDCVGEEKRGLEEKCSCCRFRPWSNLRP